MPSSGWKWSHVKAVTGVVLAAIDSRPWPWWCTTHFTSRWLLSLAKCTFPQGGLKSDPWLVNALLWAAGGMIKAWMLHDDLGCVLGVWWYVLDTVAASQWWRCWLGTLVPVPGMLWFSAAGSGSYSQGQHASLSPASLGSPEPTGMLLLRGLVIGPELWIVTLVPSVVILLVACYWCTVLCVWWCTLLEERLPAAQITQAARWSEQRSCSLGPPKQLQSRVTRKMRASTLITSHDPTS